MLWTWHHLWLHVKKFVHRCWAGNWCIS
jgi:hypothetical protein